ncbi:hypothetical protein KIN20_017338 [Parelaphostrongylus tenuis]|uniref:Uncharacterized protein n=1 Tax=Parelaphostrongylus tenuis TaxID=148309 RepID=A0AAD5MHU5_PARTN|nr:hypothetical protein KIN20_017338 [Parelaphostrongylus tenuis]
MVRLQTVSLLMNSLLIITTVGGCGVMPPGQASTRSFTVTNFKLAVSMVSYAEMESNISVEAPGITRNKEMARTFVERLVMQTVFDVLEQQGRSVLLPDTIISSILAQLQIQINCDPLECRGATVIKDSQTRNNGWSHMKIREPSLIMDAKNEISAKDCCDVHSM